MSGTVASFVIEMWFKWHSSMWTYGLKLLKVCSEIWRLESIFWLLHVWHCCLFSSLSTCRTLQVSVFLGLKYLVFRSSHQNCQCFARFCKFGFLINNKHIDLVCFIRTFLQSGSSIQRKYIFYILSFFLWTRLGCSVLKPYLCGLTFIYMISLGIFNY